MLLILHSAGFAIRTVSVNRGALMDVVKTVSLTKALLVGGLAPPYLVLVICVCFFLCFGLSMLRNA